MRFLSTPLDLSPWVQSIWSWEAGASATPEVLITPDACCEWVMHLGVPPVEWRDGAWRRQPRVFLYGQFRRALALHTDQAMRLLSVRFHPHTAAAFFGVGGGDLQAMPIEFADLCKAAAAIRWLSELGDTDEVDAIYPRLLIALRKLARQALQPDPLTATALQLIQTLTRHEPRMRVATVAKRLHTSPRKLERIFNREVGLSPKLYSRISRVHYAQSLLATSAHGLAVIAHLAGYADQSHFSREVVEFCGRTPADIRLGTRP